MLLKPIIFHDQRFLCFGSDINLYEHRRQSMTTSTERRDLVTGLDLFFEVCWYLWVRFRFQDLLNDNGNKHGDAVA